ncbi:MAG: hypothetical protein JWR65_1019 [Massilia sp.]|nr:hypothetical protein [Massilia sp.]
MDEYLFAIDTQRGLLYSKYSSTANPTSEIYVFTNIDKASGEVPLARRIRVNGNVAALGVDADRDILYAGIQEKGLTALRNASTAGFSTAVLSTPVTPLPLRGYTGLLAVDPRNDRVYIGFDNKAYTLGQASKLGQAGQEAVLSLGAGTDFTVTSFGFP